MTPYTTNSISYQLDSDSDWIVFGCQNLLPCHTKLNSETDSVGNYPDHIHP